MIHVVGLGGVGFWLAVALARDNIGPMTVWDNDTLEGGTGYHRVPDGPSTITKTKLLSDFLEFSVSGTTPTLKTQRFQGTEAQPGDWMIDCTDMPLPERRQMWAAAESAGARCLRVSYDGDQGIIVVADGLPLQGSPKGGYRNIPSFALSLAAGGLGAEIFQRLLRQTEGRVEFELSCQQQIQEIQKIQKIQERGI